MVFSRFSLVSPAVVILVALASASVHGALPAAYDANTGDADPATQGWTPIDIQVGSAQGDPELIQPPGNAGPVSAAPKTGVAWQINDQLADPATDYPRYQQTLSLAEQQSLITEGWEFTAQLRAIKTAVPDTQSAFVGWGLSFDSPHAQDEDRRCGFTVEVSGDRLRVVDMDGNTFSTRTAFYHTILARGIPGTTRYDWYFNNGYQGTLDLLDNAEGAVTAGRVVFAAGDSTQLDSTSNFRIVSLRRLSPPGIIYVDRSVLSNADGQSWATAFSNLHEALRRATRGEEIWIASGVYKASSRSEESPFRIRSGVKIYGGFPPGGGDGTFQARDPDPATNGTVLTGDTLGDDGAEFANYGDNSRRVLEIVEMGSPVLIDGLTIYGARSENDQQGIGVWCKNSEVAFRNCRFAGHQGTAAYLLASRGSFDACRFEDAERNGIHLDQSRDAEIRDCSFQACDTAVRVGKSLSSSSATIDNCLFREQRRSALIIDRGYATVSGCRFVDNFGFYGGAVLQLLGAGPCAFRNCLFQGNHAGGDGGAIFSEEAIAFINCAFQGNLADNGGAVFLKRSGSRTFLHCSFQGNNALKDGGAVYTGRSDVKATFTNCLIWQNRAQGLNSTASASIDGDDPAVQHEFRNSLVQNRDLRGGASGNLDGTDPANNPRFLRPVDPALAPVADGDLRILAGSSAIDAGRLAPEAEPTDLAGRARIQDGLPDLGAYEGPFVSSFPLLFPGLDPDADDNNNGLTNYHDYAAGFDPTVFVPAGEVLPLFHPSFHLLLRQRPAADDVHVSWEKSATLEPDSWTLFDEGTDYVLVSHVVRGVQEEFILRLLFDPAVDEKVFVRQVFTANP